MPRRGRDELLLAGEFKLDRASGLEGGQRENVFDQQFLLATKAASDAFT